MVQLDVQGYLAAEGSSGVNAEEFLEILNSDPAFVGASLLSTGNTQFDLDDASMFLWQSEVMENSHLFAIREQDGTLAAVLTLLIPHPKERQPWIGALIVHRALGFNDVAIPLLDALERKLATDKWDAVYVSPMKSRRDVIEHWKSFGYIFVEARLDNDRRDVHVLRKSLIES